MKPVRSTGLNNSPEHQQYMAEQNAKVLAGNVSFGSTMNNSDQDRNVLCTKATGTTPGTPNTNFTISHTLGRAPIGAIAISLNQPGASIQFISSTTTSITLACNVASVAYSILII